MFPKLKRSRNYTHNVLPNKFGLRLAIKLLSDFWYSDVTKWKYTNRDRRVTQPLNTLNMPLCGVQLQSLHLIWFTPVDLFLRSEVMSGNKEHTGIQNKFSAFLMIKSQESFFCKSTSLTVTVSHRPAAIQTIKMGSDRKSLFLHIAHFEMKRILMKTRLKSCMNHARFSNTL